MARDRRRSERWAYLDAVTFRVRGRRSSGRLLNVARSGAFVGTDVAPQPGEPVHLQLERAHPAIELRGVVRWSGQRLSDDAQGFGVEIIDPPEDYLALVTSVAIREPGGAGRRPAPRVSVSLPVAIEHGTVCDEGLLCDVSLSGARLENTGVQPVDGAELVLTFALSLDIDPFDVPCRVVRRTSTGGYAVQFHTMDPRLEAAVDRAATLVRDLPEPL